MKITIKVKFFDKATQKFIWYRQAENANGGKIYIKESSLKRKANSKKRGKKNGIEKR